MKKFLLSLSLLCGAVATHASGFPPVASVPSLPPADNATHVRQTQLMFIEAINCGRQVAAARGIPWSSLATQSEPVVRQLVSDNMQHLSTCVQGRQAAINSTMARAKQCFQSIPANTPAAQYDQYSLQCMERAQPGYLNAMRAIASDPVANRLQALK